MLPTKFRFNWLSSFREDDFQKSTNQIQELPVAAMFVNESGQNQQSLQKTFHRCFLPNFSSFGILVSEKNFQKSPNQKQEWPVAAIFVNGSELNEQSLQRTFHRCFLPSFDSFGLAVSEEKIFQKSTNQKQEWPVVAMFINRLGRNEQSLQRTFHRCLLPSFGSFLFWPCGFRGEDLKKSTNQKQEWPVAAMFVNGTELNEQSLQRTFHRCFLPGFDSFGLAVSEKIFQKSTNQKQEWPVAAMFINRSGRNEQYLQRTFHRCLLPSFGSSGHAVSDEKIFKNRPIRNKNCLWWPCLLMDRDKMSNLYTGKINKYFLHWNFI